MTELPARLLVDPLVGAFGRVAAFFPSLAAALLLLIVGMFGARLARVLVESSLSWLRLDQHTSRFGLNELLARLGLGKSPTEVAAFSASWFVLMVFVVSAADAADITAVSALVERFVLFLPSLIAAALTVFGGLLFARLVDAVLQNAAAANAVRGGVFVARGAYALVVLFAAGAALEQVGVERKLVSAAAQILLGSAGLGLSIAFGLGAKDLAGEFLRGLASKKP
jgi:hypothetical protein